MRWQGNNRSADIYYGLLGLAFWMVVLFTLEFLVRLPFRTAIPPQADLPDGVSIAGYRYPTFLFLGESWQLTIVSDDLIEVDVNGTWTGKFHSGTTVVIGGEAGNSGTYHVDGRALATIPESITAVKVPD